MVVKLLEVGDIHARGTSPRNRLDDYTLALKRKMQEVFKLAQVHQVDAIICPGDVFDSYQVSIAVLLDFVSLFRQSPVPIFTTAGNHDLPSYNLETYYRTSLHLLEMLVPQLRVINDPSEAVVIKDLVQLTFTPYSGKMDVAGYGYSPEGEAAERSDLFKIHVSHGMLLDHTPPFDRYTLVQEVETEADVVFCGHDHTGFGIFHRQDGRTFVNLGSLTRLSASVTEMERPIQAALITVDPENYEKGFDLEAITLESAQPGSQILDRSGLEAEQKRQYAMEQFSALIQGNDGEAVAVNVEQMVEMIAKRESIAPEVVALALAKIEQQVV